MVATEGKLFSFTFPFNEEVGAKFRPANNSNNEGKRSSQKSVPRRQLIRLLQNCTLEEIKVEDALWKTLHDTQRIGDNPTNDGMSETVTKMDGFVIAARTAASDSLPTTQIGTLASFQSRNEDHSEKMALAPSLVALESSDEEQGRLRRPRWGVDNAPPMEASPKTMLQGKNPALSLVGNMLGKKQPNESLPGNAFSGRKPPPQPIDDSQFESADEEPMEFVEKVQPKYASAAGNTNLETEQATTTEATTRRGKDKSSETIPVAAADAPVVVTTIDDDDEKNNSTKRHSAEAASGIEPPASTSNRRGNMSSPVNNPNARPKANATSNTNKTPVSKPNPPKDKSDNDVDDDQVIIVAVKKPPARKPIQIVVLNDSEDIEEKSEDPKAAAATASTPAKSTQGTKDVSSFSDAIVPQPNWFAKPSALDKKTVVPPTQKTTAKRQRPQQPPPPPYPRPTTTTTPALKVPTNASNGAQTKPTVKTTKPLPVPAEPTTTTVVPLSSTNQNDSKDVQTPAASSAGTKPNPPVHKTDSGSSEKASTTEPAQATLDLSDTKKNGLADSTQKDRRRDKPTTPKLHRTKLGLFDFRLS